MDIPEYGTLEWIWWADDVFECYRPAVDLHAVMRELLRLALTHEDSNMRLEALDTLGDGFGRHPEAKIDVRDLAEKLKKMDGEELLDAMRVIAFSQDRSLADYIMPYLESENPNIRDYAVEALFELGVLNEKTE